MVAACDHQLRLGILGVHGLERLNQRFQPLVRSPFSKGENALRRSCSPRKIRILRMLRQYPMGAEVDIPAAIPLEQDVAICRHQHGYGIRQQEHSR